MRLEPAVVLEPSGTPPSRAKLNVGSRVHNDFMPSAWVVEEVYRARAAECDMCRDPLVLGAGLHAVRADDLAELCDGCADELDPWRFERLVTARLERAAAGIRPG